MKLKAVWVSLALLAFGVGNTFAKSSEGSGKERGYYKEDKSEPSEAASILDQVYLGFATVYHGEAIHELTSAQTVDTNGNPLSKKSDSINNVNFDSELSGGYRINSDYRVGVVIPFLYYPVDGQDFSLGDIGVKFFSDHTVHTENFNLSTNLIFQAPTNDYSQHGVHMSYGIKSTPHARYKIPNSKFVVGSFSEFKEYMGVTKGKTFKMVYLPYVRYELNSKLSLNLAYEFDYRHYLHETGFLSFSTYQTDIQPGVVWNITKKVSLNPYFQIFMTQQPSMDHTAIGAYLSATIL